LEGQQGAGTVGGGQGGPGEIIAKGADHLGFELEIGVLGATGVFGQELDQSEHGGVEVGEGFLEAQPGSGSVESEPCELQGVSGYGRGWGGVEGEGLEEGEEAESAGGGKEELGFEGPTGG
jgi:hypothetical protein